MDRQKFNSFNRKRHKKCHLALNIYNSLYWVSLRAPDFLDLLSTLKCITHIESVTDSTVYLILCLWSIIHTVTVFYRTESLEVN